MPTYILIVGCSLFQKDEWTTKTPIVLKNVASKLYDDISRKHPNEEFTFLFFDGEKCDLISDYTQSFEEHIANLENSSMPSKFRFISQTTTQNSTKYLIEAIKSTFPHILSVYGGDTLTQLILLADTSFNNQSTTTSSTGNDAPPMSEDYSSLVCDFGLRLHFFCVAPTLQKQQQQQEEGGDDYPNTNSAMTTVDKGLKRYLERFSNAFNGGTFIVNWDLELAQTSNSTLNGKEKEDLRFLFTTKALAQFINNVAKQTKLLTRIYYKKYRGYLSLGHLVSPINLLPDPNLIFLKKPKNSANSVLHCKYQKHGNVKIPEMIPIVGFVKSEFISSGGVDSLHSLIFANSDQKKDKKHFDKKEIPKELKQKIQKKFGKIMFADSCLQIANETSISNLNPATSTSNLNSEKTRNQFFFEILMETMQKNKLTAIVDFTGLSQKLFSTKKNCERDGNGSDDGDGERGGDGNCGKYGYICVGTCGAEGTTPPQLVLGTFTHRNPLIWSNVKLSDLVGNSEREAHKFPLFNPSMFLSSNSKNLFNFLKTEGYIFEYGEDEPSNKVNDSNDYGFDFQFNDNKTENVISCNVYLQRPTSLDFFSEEALQMEFQKVLRSLQSTPTKKEAIIEATKKIIRCSLMYLNVSPLKALMQMIADFEGEQDEEDGDPFLKKLRIEIQQMLENKKFELNEDFLFNDQ